MLLQIRNGKGTASSHLRPSSVKISSKSVIGKQHLATDVRATPAAAGPTTVAVAMWLGRDRLDWRASCCQSNHSRSTSNGPIAVAVGNVVGSGQVLFEGVLLPVLSPAIGVSRSLLRLVFGCWCQFDSLTPREEPHTQMGLSDVAPLPRRRDTRLTWTRAINGESSQRRRCSWITVDYDDNWTYLQFLELKV